MANFLNTVSAVGALVMAATPLMAAGSFAHAAPAPVRIQVSDLDLSRPADAARLDARIQRAADSFCDAMQTGSSLSDTPACREAVRTEALQKLSPEQRSAIRTASAGTSWQVAGE